MKFADSILAKPHFFCISLIVGTLELLFIHLLTNGVLVKQLSKTMF